MTITNQERRQLALRKVYQGKVVRVSRRDDPYYPILEELEQEGLVKGELIEIDEQSSYKLYTPIVVPIREIDDSDIRIELEQWSKPLWAFVR